MKNQFLLFLLTPFFGFAQTLESPKNVIVTSNQISGNANQTFTVKVDRNGDGVADHTIVVNHRGFFEQDFQTAFPNASIDVWSEDENGDTSPVVNYIIQTPADILREIGNNTKKYPLRNSRQIINPDLNGLQPINSTYKYKVRIATTNFAIPVARFNMALDESNGNKIGDVTLFNSVGAGIGISWGELEMTSDENSGIINRDYVNHFGMSFGVLFSAGSGGEQENQNIFAPTFTLSTLDIQFGVGYELGTVVDNQSRFFFTLAYAIPLSKLLKGKFFVFKASKGFNDSNPLIDTDEDWDKVKSFK